MGKVYTWYFAKLEAMGVNTNADQEEKELFLNPSRLEEIQKLKQERDA